MQNENSHVQLRADQTDLPGVLILEPEVYADARGLFYESFHADKYRAFGIHGPFVQDNFSRSVLGTIRGLHLQVKRPQGKLIRVIQGEIRDIAVDVRRGSPYFGHWVSVDISADSFQQVYVPPGFAHGFSVLSATAEVEYKCTTPYDPNDEVGIIWNDPTLNIDWGWQTTVAVSKGLKAPLLSTRDANHADFAGVFERLPLYVP